MLKDRLQLVRQRIQQACRRCGRDPASVALVAVTKGVTAQTLQEAHSLGLREFGENRVQEAREKQSALGSGFGAQGRGPQPTAQSPQRIRWHLVGHLQRNKAKDAVELFQVIHSLDSIRLAEELERQAAKKAQGSGFGARGKCPQPSARSPERIDVFIQVNVSGEATKSGCREDEVLRLAQDVAELPHLRLTGLMTMAPYAEDAEASRPYFRRLRELRDALHLSSIIQHPSLKLSMGMSHDVEVAIEEGADVVRIGTALFGPRQT